MRNALTELAQTVENPEEKKLFETEMDNFFSLFRRYLNDKSKGNAVYVISISGHSLNLLNDISSTATGIALPPLPRARSLTTKILPTPSLLASSTSSLS